MFYSIANVEPAEQQRLAAAAGSCDQPHDFVREHEQAAARGVLEGPPARLCVAASDRVLTTACPARVPQSLLLRQRNQTAKQSQPDLWQPDPTLTSKRARPDLVRGRTSRHSARQPPLTAARVSWLFAVPAAASDRRSLAASAPNDQARRSAAVDTISASFIVAERGEDAPASRSPGQPPCNAADPDAHAGR